MASFCFCSDQYRCDKCKLKVDASKLLAIKTLPGAFSLSQSSCVFSLLSLDWLYGCLWFAEVLTVHIKRFSHNSYFGNKLSRHIIFPAKYSQL